MRRRRRPDLFRPDRGLQARMLLAAVCTPLIVLACAAAIVALAPFKLVAAFAIAAAIGIGGSITERRNRPRAEPVTPAQAPELHAIVDRLCVLADVPKPEIVIEPERQPNSWLVGLSRERARLHVTRGLLELLTPAELEAVVGHELAHLVNRDAAVMTAVGGPGAILLDGGKRMLRGGWWFAPDGRRGRRGRRAGLAARHPGALARSRARGRRRIGRAHRPARRPGLGAAPDLRPAAR